jgi:CheY-like chemotaxis protein
MPRILVTDDDPVQLKLQKLVLEGAGHKVSVASDSSGTLDQLEHGRPDLVIMDLRLLNAAGNPDAREGMALIRRMRERGSATPVIVLSGWPEELCGQAEEQMVARVIAKPVLPKELLKAINELITRTA